MANLIGTKITFNIIVLNCFFLLASQPTYSPFFGFYIFFLVFFCFLFFCRVTHQIRPKKKPTNPYFLYFLFCGGQHIEPINPSFEKCELDLLANFIKLDQLITAGS